MQLKGIKKYSHLLVDMAHQLGTKKEDIYAFVEREKANFSNVTALKSEENNLYR